MWGQWRRPCVDLTGRADSGWSGGRTATGRRGKTRGRRRVKTRGWRRERWWWRARKRKQQRCLHSLPSPPRPYPPLLAPSSLRLYSPHLPPPPHLLSHQQPLCPTAGLRAYTDIPIARTPPWQNYDHSARLSLPGASSSLSVPFRLGVFSGPRLVASMGRSFACFSTTLAEGAVVLYARKDGREGRVSICVV